MKKCRFKITINFLPDQEERELLFEKIRIITTPMTIKEAKRLGKLAVGDWENYEIDWESLP